MGTKSEGSREWEAENVGSSRVGGLDDDVAGVGVVDDGIAYGE